LPSWFKDNIYFLSNSLIEAKKYYLEAVRTDKRNAEARYNLALISEKLNEKDEAVKHYKAFLKIAPPEYDNLIPQVKRKVSANRSGQQW
jgi:tetratricopeptide (TPR) repeat protein